MNVVYPLYLVGAFVALWLMRFLFRRKDRVVAGSNEELFSIIGICLTISYLMAGVIYVFLHMMMLWITPNHTIVW